MAETPCTIERGFDWIQWRCKICSRIVDAEFLDDDTQDDES
jgi:hypothetical protein